MEARSWLNAMKALYGLRDDLDDSEEETVKAIGNRGFVIVYNINLVLAGIFIFSLFLTFDLGGNYFLYASLLYVVISILLNFGVGIRVYQLLRRNNLRYREFKGSKFRRSLIFALVFTILRFSYQIISKWLGKGGSIFAYILDPQIILSNLITFLLFLGVFYIIQSLLSSTR